MTDSTAAPSAHHGSDVPSQSAAHPRLAAPAAASTAELARLKMRLRGALRQFPDFPSPGVLFEDILPIFADPALHDDLLHALQLHVQSAYGQDGRPDVILGLEARGFLFGPSLALRLGSAFVPVRKRGKLPGPTERARYQKEYGWDEFEIQHNAIKPGQTVLIVDDIIATGMTSAAWADTQTHTHKLSLSLSPPLSPSLPPYLPLFPCPADHRWHGCRA